MLLAALAHAQPVPVVAELFTSEGCSSCPPADALLQQLDQAQPVAGARVIVLSEHVDYWDHLGWRDPFSAPQFTARQERYARLLGGEVYTPQLVVDGRAPVLGNNPEAVVQAIARAASRTKLPVRIASARREGGEAVFAVSIPALAKGRADVWAAVASEAVRSSVSRGENAGRVLAHVAVVRHMAKAGAIGKEGMETTLRAPVGSGPARVVVFLSDSAGQVAGADFVKLP